MSTYSFEEVVVPHGSFIGWGNYAGQFVTGKVLDYDPAGGTDFNGATCPQLSLELVEPAASFDKDGNRTDYQAGELVVLTCGLVSLKRAIKAADPSPGDVIKATLDSFEKAPNGTVKVFKLQIARGAAPEARRQSQPQQQGNPFTQQAAPQQAQDNPFAQPAQQAQQPATQPQQQQGNPFTQQAAPQQAQDNPFAQPVQQQTNPFG